VARARERGQMKQYADAAAVETIGRWPLFG
jgi:hypothetical protein